jgi:hypothetical protein
MSWEERFAVAGIERRLKGRVRLVSADWRFDAKARFDGSDGMRRMMACWPPRLKNC